MYKLRECELLQPRTLYYHFIYYKNANF